MQGIYNYITETNHVSRVYSVAAVLYLQSVLQVMLFHPWNMFCTFTLALSVLCVQCPILLFFFFSYFPDFMLSWYVSQVLSEWFWNGPICWISI
jgi:Na+/glutamate symporter